MTEVIFQETETQTTVDETSIEIHNQLREYLNQAQQETLQALKAYHKEKDEWPTCRELIQYSDLHGNTLQPRLTNDLREKHIVEKAGKRPCKASDHNIKVNTWKVIQ